MAFTVRGPLSNQPSANLTCTSAVASFSLATSGAGPFTYQWRKNATPINTTLNPSAATATLTLTNVQLSDAGSYDCVVTNAFGSVTSNPATLDVYALCTPTPPLTITAGVPDAFSPDNGLEMGTPRPAFAAHLAQRLPGRALLHFDSDSRHADEYNRFVAHSFTGLPADITAATVTTRARAGGTNGADNEGTDSVSVGHSFSATDFQGYKRFFGNEHSPFLFNFPWRRYTSSPQCDQTFTTPPLGAAIIARMNTLGYLDFLVEDDTAVDYVTLQATRATTNTGATVAWAGPISGPASACLGQSFTMTVAAGGTNRTYQWLKFGTPISPASNPTATTQSLVIPNFQVTDGGLYSCIVSNAFQTQTSPPYAPAIGGPSCTPADCSPPTITAQPPDRAACAGNTVTFTTAATSTAPGVITYRWRQDGVFIDPALNPSAATRTLLVVVTSGLQAGLYDCQIITGSGCGYGSTRLATLTVGGPACVPACVPPVVTTQPAGTIVCPGNRVTLIAAATGTGTVTYRWRKDGVLMSTTSNPSAAMPTLVIPQALSRDRGSYTCSISDAGGCAPVTTAAAVLRVGGSVCGVYAWDSADFNRNGARNAADLASYDLVISGQACPSCGDTDVNNDGVTNAQDRVDLARMIDEGSTGGGGDYTPRNYAVSPPGLASPPGTVPCESWNGGTTTLTYHPPGGIDVPISLIPLSVNISNCLESNSISIFGVEVSQALNESANRASLSAKWEEYTALQDAIAHIQTRLDEGNWSWGGNFTIAPCISIDRPLGRARGSMSSYVFNIGNAGYTSIRMVNAFRACDTMVITVEQPVTLEIPLHIQGGITVAESFGDSSITSATGELSLQGTIGGSSIPEMTIEVESISAPPITKTISEHRTFPMSFAPGTTTLAIDITGRAIIETTAKASAGSGIIAGAATAVVDYPDTIEVGMIRGLNNTPLPPGVLITSQRTGAIFADTRVNTCGPQIIGQPANASVCRGGTAVFTVGVNSPSPMTYIWTLNGNPISPSQNPSAATATLTVSNVLPSKVGTYRCVVRNACGGVSTGAATLAICYADFNCVNGVSVSDIFAFLAAWFANDPRADVNGGGISVSDIFSFITLWFAGC